MSEEKSYRGFLGSVYYLLRGIMITIGITPPQPGNEKWVALIFFGTCALLIVAMIFLGAWLLRAMMLLVPGNPSV